MSVRQNRRFINKLTAYTINPAAGDAPGTIFTNRGATGSLTWTLPAPAAQFKGWFFDFINMAAQNMIVSAGTGKAITFNNLTAASLAAQTGGQLIGAKVRATCDGTSWVLEGTSVGVTYTVA